MHKNTLNMLCVVLSCLCCTSVQAQERAFPRCALDEASSTAFLAHYADAHLLMSEGEFKRARTQFTSALKLCMDDEVIWFLARVHEALGEQKKAAKLDETWRTQRELQGLSVTPPSAPAVHTDEVALELESTSVAKTYSGTYPIPLPSLYKHTSTVDTASVNLGVFPPAKSLAKLSVQVSPEQGATLWLADGEFVGKAPLDEVMIPANVDLVLVVKIEDKQVLVRSVNAKSGTHHRLFITLPK